jgi:UDP-N-acetylmuramyl pentapeptide phosphotransferase/UDP-N-acetylglucosamine-1-phosphate transferase
MTVIYCYIVLLLVALCTTWWIFKKILKIAILKNIVDNPDQRKIQRAPVPVLGGIAVFFGIVISITMTALFYDATSLFAILGVMVIMLYIGVMDDILSLSPTVRFIIESVVVLILVFSNNYSINHFHGLWGMEEISMWISVPLTVVACVGILNAINMIDGVNGLLSGYCIVACSLFAAAFIWADDRDAASLALISIGALLPFFFHTVFGKKSKMFIGDGGALLMGTIISTFIIGALNSNSPLAEKVDENFGLIPFTLAVLAIPVFDTLRVMFGRICRGVSPFQADKTHLHHMLFGLGFSHIGITLFEILSNLMVVLAWWISYRLGASISVQLYVVVLLAIMVTTGFYEIARISEKRNNKLYKLMVRFGHLTREIDANYFVKFKRLLDMGCDNITPENTVTPDNTTPKNKENV